MKSVFNRTVLVQAAISLIIFNLGSAAYQYYFGEPAEIAVIDAMPKQLIVDKPLPGKASRFIRIDTGKMTVWLDKQGGRISRAIFNDYKVRDGDEDIGFFGMDANSYLETQAGIVGDEKLTFSSQKNQYRVTEGTERVVLQATSSKGVRYSKEFVFSANGYEIDMRVSAQNGSNDPVALSSYFVISGDKVTPLEKSAPKANDLSFDQQAEKMVSAVRSYSGVSYTTKNKPNVRVKFADMDSRGADVTIGGWVAFQKHHFIAAWVLENNAYKINNFWKEGKVSTDSENFEQRFATQVLSARKELSPGESFVEKAKLYVGPQDPKALALLDTSLRLTMDYGFFWMFASFLHKGLDLIHKVVPSWPLCLVLLTVLLRLVFYKSLKEQAIQTQKIKAMKPEQDEIERRFADRGRFDAEKSEAMVKLYKKHNFKALSLAVFMPFLQLPLFIAFYGMVSVAVEFRAAPFLWMSDVSMPDPFYILPVLAVISMYFQSAEMGGSEEFKAVAKYMPLIFAFFVIKFPAALQLYIGVSTGLGVLQNKILVKNKR